MQPYREAENVSEDPDAERIRAALSRDLDDGESFVWIGRPCKRVVLGPLDYWGMFVGFLFTFVSAAWEKRAFERGSLLRELWGVPAIAAGLYSLFGRIFYVGWRNGRTYYGLTDRRVLLVFEGLTRVSTSFDLDTLSISTAEYRDGSGTISLMNTRSAASTDVGSFADSTWPNAGGKGAPALVRVPRARAVATMIRDAIAARRPSEKSTESAALAPDASVARSRADAAPREAESSRARVAIDSELGPDESVVWAGAPKQGFYWSVSNVGRAFFGFLLVVAGLWLGHAETDSAGALGRATLCLLGVAIAVVPAFLAPREAARTFYGVTDQRVLVVRDFNPRNVVSIALEHVAPEVVVYGAIGTIYLESRTDADNRGRSNYRESFDDIAQPRQVEKQIREAMAKRQARR